MATKKEQYTLIVNGKSQPDATTRILAALVASPFAAETAAVVDAVMQNKKFLAALKKAAEVVYEDAAKTITTDGQTLVSVLPRLAEYHQKAAELAAMRDRLNKFRKVEWKKQRGRKGGQKTVVEVMLEL